MAQDFKETQTEYKYVREVKNSAGSIFYKAAMGGMKCKFKTSFNKTFNNKREAAIAVDKYLIGKGKEPINILVRK